jgi:alkanesulfonate monooxygenase SsuD/methylene tetrahydromethanopterin reductase-like flavin-dependent oxidoreductase (luciferase family)
MPVKPVTRSGRTRAALQEQRVYPPTTSGSLRTWIGVGGTPASVVRAAKYGLPLMLAVIGGDHLNFVPFVELYERSLKEAGRAMLPIGAHSPGHVADTDQQARDELWPHYAAMMERIGRERGWGPPTRAAFEQSAGPTGALCVGSPATVAAKIIRAAKALRLSRFDLKYSNGALPHGKLMRSIELYATEVVPLVHAGLA